MVISIVSAVVEYPIKGIERITQPPPEGGGGDLYPIKGIESFLWDSLDMLNSMYPIKGIERVIILEHYGI